MASLGPLSHGRPDGVQLSELESLSGSLPLSGATGDIDLAVCLLSMVALE